MHKTAIRVVDPNSESGYKNINKDRYDPEIHTLYVEGRDPQSDALAAATKESVAKMKKSDVVELLEAHNIEFDKSAPVADLREKALTHIFGETEKCEKDAETEAEQAREETGLEEGEFDVDEDGKSTDDEDLLT